MEPVEVSSIYTGNASYRGSVLYVGPAYYHAWYLSRALRKLGWRADVLNWDSNPNNDIFYHGEDFRFKDSRKRSLPSQLLFYAKAALSYDIFHFSFAGGMHFGHLTQSFFSRVMKEYEEIRMLKRLGKKIVHSYSGCNDGVSQTAFSKWKPYSSCPVCPWRERPDVCSDERNLRMGHTRNALADYVCIFGGNRADYNEAPTVHEVPEFYCLDSEFWKPTLEIPVQFRLGDPRGAVRIFHAVGNYDARTGAGMKNIKGTHVYVPVIEQLKKDGLNVELVFAKNVPNKELRYLQVQSDIILENLFAGFIGATAREGLMLGKPVLAFISPEQLAYVRRDVPSYAEDFPVVDIRPETVYAVLRDLVLCREKREGIGRRSREFALRWHSMDVAATRFDTIYSELLGLR
jgi:glycosyltransferase involved in cell wall biosynthesis